MPQRREGFPTKPTSRKASRIFVSQFAATRKGDSEFDSSFLLSIQRDLNHDFGVIRCRKQLHGGLSRRFADHIFHAGDKAGIFTLPPDKHHGAWLRRIVCHAGSSDQFRSCLALHPEASQTLVVLEFHAPIGIGAGDFGFSDVLVSVAAFCQRFQWLEIQAFDSGPFAKIMPCVIVAMFAIRLSDA